MLSRCRRRRQASAKQRKCVSRVSCKISSCSQAVRPACMRHSSCEGLQRHPVHQLLASRPLALLKLFDCHGDCRHRPLLEITPTCDEQHAEASRRCNAHLRHPKIFAQVLAYYWQLYLQNALSQTGGSLPLPFMGAPFMPPGGDALAYQQQQQLQQQVPDSMCTSLLQAPSLSTLLFATRFVLSKGSI